MELHHPASIGKGPYSVSCIEKELGLGCVLLGPKSRNVRSGLILTILSFEVAAFGLGFMGFGFKV